MRHILSTFICLLGVVSVAYGAEVELPKGYNPLAELEIGAFPKSPEIVSATLSSQKERIVSVSFALRVEEGIHPQTDVRLALAKKGEGSESFVYETNGEGGYTLGSENSPLKGVMTHTFPDALKGDFTLYLLMRDRGGAVTALSPVGTVTLRDVPLSGDAPRKSEMDRAPLMRSVLTKGNDGLEIQVMVREQEPTAMPRTLEVKTYGSAGMCGTPLSRGVENRTSVVRIPIALGDTCNEPVTLLTLREGTGAVLDEVRVPHTLSASVVIPKEDTEVAPVPMPTAYGENRVPVVLYVALFGAMVILLVLGVLIKKYKKDEKPALSPRLLLVIALMALFFSVGSHFVHAAEMNASSCDLGCEGSVIWRANASNDVDDFTCPFGTRLTTNGGSWTGPSCSGTFTKDPFGGTFTCVADPACSVPPPPPAPSSAPSPFVVSANTTCSSAEITTTWGSVSGATGYDIEVNGSVTTGVSSPFIQSGIGDNTSRTYRVRATNGGGQGPWTGVQSGMTAGSCATPPLVPTGVEANPNPTPGSGVITVIFNPSPGATSYTIRDNGVVISSGSGATTFDHTGLTPGSSHSYTVSAENGAGSSGQSAPPVPATATVGAPLPSAPTGLTPTPGAPGSGEILVTWNPVPGASGYTLHETVTGNTVTIPGTTYTHGGLTPGDTYTYVVRTETVSGSSVWSAPESAVAPVGGGTACTPQVNRLCTMSTSGNNGDTAGSCSPLGIGSCTYTCNGVTGIWEETTYSCVPPSIDELHICTDATETNCNLDGAGMGGGGSSVSVCYDSSNAERCEFTAPGGLGTGGSTNRCVGTTLGAIAGGVTLTCYNLDGGSPVSPISSSLTPVPPPPPPTLRSSLNIVGIGKPVTLTWNTNGPHENTCTLNGAGVSTADLVSDGGAITTGDVSVNVKGRTTFEIICGGQSGKVTVDVVPEGHES